MHVLHALAKVRMVFING